MGIPRSESVSSPTYFVSTEVPYSLVGYEGPAGRELTLRATERRT